jgi:hypothetical protein
MGYGHQGAPTAVQPAAQPTESSGSSAMTALMTGMREAFTNMLERFAALVAVAVDTVAVVVVGATSTSHLGTGCSGMTTLAVIPAER